MGIKKLVSNLWDGLVNLDGGTDMVDIYGDIKDSFGVWVPDIKIDKDHVLSSKNGTVHDFTLLIVGNSKYDYDQVNKRLIEILADRLSRDKATIAPQTLLINDLGL